MKTFGILFCSVLMFCFSVSAKEVEGDNNCEGGIEEPLPLSLPRREGGIDSTAIVLFIISYFWKKSLKKKFEYE